MNNDNFERVCAEAVSCSRCFPAAGAARAFVLFERQRTRFPDWGLRFVASPHYAASFVIDFDAIRNLVRERHEYGDLP